MKSEADCIYLGILTSGLLALRTAAENGDIEACRQESDHLHNIPSLIGEANLERHRYYLSTERVRYLEWVQSRGDKDLLINVGRAYFGRWRELEKMFGLEQGEQ